MSYRPAGDIEAVGAPTVELTSSREKRQDWHELAAKVSVVVGLLTLITVMQQSWRRR